MIAESYLKKLWVDCLLYKEMFVLTFCWLLPARSWHNPFNSWAGFSKVGKPVFTEKLEIYYKSQWQKDNIQKLKDRKSAFERKAQKLQLKQAVPKCVNMRNKQCSTTSVQSIITFHIKDSSFTEFILKLIVPL